MIDNCEQPWKRIERTWKRHRVWLIALSLTLLGAALRLYRIDANGYNTDEVWSIWAGQLSVSRIVQLAFESDDGTPPAYYLALHALLPLGQDPLTVRVLSVLAGTLMVWLTFRLALDLFGLRVAALSGCLIAIAPLHILYSQVARAYLPASLAALFSLYFFAGLLFQRAQKYHWVGLVTATAASLWMFYTPLLLVLFENACVALLWLRRRLSKSWLLTWVASQGVIILLALPCLLYVFRKAGVRQSWVPRPGMQSLIKTAILFGTGDPSYGPIGVTAARVLSLLAIVGAVAMGTYVFLRRRYHLRLHDEGRQVLFLAGAFLVPLTAAFVMSQGQSIYTEKYLIFLMPPMLILFAWVLAQTWRMVASKAVFILLAVMTASALVVCYSEPFGEQWREAVSFVHSSPDSEAPAIVAPGFYSRPFTYYYSGNLPADADTLERAPAVLFARGEWMVLGPTYAVSALSGERAALTKAEHVWFVSGDAPVDPGVTEWLEKNFELLEARTFVGVHLRLLQRTGDTQAEVTSDRTGCGFRTGARRIVGQGGRPFERCRS